MHAHAVNGGYDDYVNINRGSLNDVPGDFIVVSGHFMRFHWVPAGFSGTSRVFQGSNPKSPLDRNLLPFCC